MGDKYEKLQFSQVCSLCNGLLFDNAESFAKHLRNSHCVREGGSFVCLYGENGVCSSLPVEGISNVDYEQHIHRNHVHSLRESHQRYMRQSGSGIASIFSMDTSDKCEKWDVYSASQNLANVLNNPNKSKQKDFFTKVWGENFVELKSIPNPPCLPTVTAQDFEPYMKKVLKRYRRRANLIKSLAIKSAEEESENGSSKSTDQLSNIPSIFLKYDFDLSHPDTFNLVFPHLIQYNSSSNNNSNFNNNNNNNNNSNIRKKSSDNYEINNILYASKSSQRPKLVQEKLGHYLDTVEVQIAKQVSSKSDAFFHTMTSHDALMENLGQTLSKVRYLRNKIAEVNSSLVKNLLYVMKNTHRKNNEILVLKKLRIMTAVCQTQPTVKLLLSTYDYVAALELIYTTKELLNIELSGIHCFRHLSSNLNSSIKEIENLMEREMEKYAASDLNRPLVDCEIETLDKPKLLSIVLGLLRRKHYPFIDFYLEEASSAIQAAVKQSVIEIVVKSDSPLLHMAPEHTTEKHGSGASFAAETSHTLDEQLKMLTVDDWVILLKNTAVTLGIILQRLKSVHDTIMEAISICYNSSENSSSINNEAEEVLSEVNYNMVVKKLNGIITYTCENVCETYSQLLSKRSLATFNRSANSTPKSKAKINNNWLAEQASLAQLRDIYEYVNDLCGICTKLNPAHATSISLKSAFKNEVSKFINKFHDDRSRKIDMILGNENWKQTPVPIEFQTLIDEIVETGKFSMYKASQNSSDLGENTTSDVICIKSEKFVVIGTLALLIHTIAEYCICAENSILPANDLLRCLVDLLQNFNRKTCKLVLGAEAISERTGLKRITGTNLALLMRTLQLLIVLIPFIKKHFTELLPFDAQKSFNNVQEEIQSHIEDIRKQILSLPYNTISAEIRRWEAKPPMPSVPFKNIWSDLKKLHDVISVILRPDDVSSLYRRINLYFKTILRHRIGEMNIVNNGGPEHGCVILELTFYLENLKRLRTLPESELGDAFMDDLWRN